MTDQDKTIVAAKKLENSAQQLWNEYNQQADRVSGELPLAAEESLTHAMAFCKSVYQKLDHILND